jgi:protein-disulfide isomerase
MASGKASKRKRAQQRVQAPPPKQGVDNRVWIAAAVAAALVVAVVVGIVATRGGDENGAAATGSTLPSAAEEIALFRGVPQDGLALGDPDAPVTLVEFADLQCPFCREFEVEALPALVEKHVRAGTLRLEFRGMAFIGPDSERGLRAVLGAAEQDNLYELKALLYANQGGENAGWLTEDLVAAAARSIPGLAVEQLLDDMDSGAVGDELAAHAAEAERRGVNSTPTVLVGPTGGDLRIVQMSTASDVEAIEQAIAAAQE